MRLLFEEMQKRDLPESARGALDHCEVISADNVAEVYYLSEQIDWDIVDDFPNCAPPFQHFFIEYSPPQYGNYKEGFRQSLSHMHNMRFGLLFNCHNMSEERFPAVFDKSIYAKNARWIYEIVLFGNGPNKNAHCAWFLNIDETGRVALLENGNAYGFVTDKKLVEYLAGHGLVENPSDVFVMHLHVALLAISFMHCKNVTLVSNIPHKSPSGRNKHKPKITYKTLEIEPMKKVLRSEGDSDHVGIKKALHICRGHFKDYREHGLFGRNKDIYWWDGHVRGSVQNGIVNKDYNVHSVTT